MRFGVTRLILTGMVSVAVGYVLFLPIGLDSSYVLGMLPTFILAGIGFALAFGPLNVAGTSGVAPEEQGLAGGLLNTSFQFGGALVLAIVTAVNNAYAGAGGTPQDTLAGLPRGDRRLGRSRRARHRRDDDARSSQGAGRRARARGRGAPRGSSLNRVGRCRRRRPTPRLQDVGVTVEDSVEIAPGIRMPLVGLGTWQARGDEVQTAVRQALELGYRSIDTAQMYGNEQEVGRAMAESALARDEIFVTTKMWPDRAGRERETLEESLALLGLDRVDLWLIHWPPGGRARPDVWERFLEAQADGLARAVGVSNYDLAQLDEFERATGRLPAVNQIEWSPFAPTTTHTLDEHRRRRGAGRGLQPAEDDQSRRRTARPDRRGHTASARRGS